MGKIIAIQTSQEYDAHLKETIDILEKTEDDLFVQAINLCTTSVWKEWSDQKGVGEKMEFDTEMIKESGDENAIQLVEMMERVNWLRGKLMLDSSE